MDKELVKDWLENLLIKRFNARDLSIENLSYLDMFYLYIEIYRQYGIKLPVELIQRPNLNADILIDYICKKLSN